MSSLTFKKPLRIKGLPEEAAAEWEGLHVGLASMFAYNIGCVAEEPDRIWDEEKGIYRFDGPFEHDPRDYGNKLLDDHLWISRQALIHACRYAQPKRTHILAWLEDGEGRHFHHFCVSEAVAECID